MMKYKVGDRVKVRSDLTLSELYDGYWAFDEMIKKKIVTITFVHDDHYEIKEDTFYWTDKMFEELVEDELTAAEVIRLNAEMCGNLSCSECKCSRRNNSKDIPCNKFLRKYPEQVIEILKQWKKGHDKKKVETEIIDIVRVMKEENSSTTCIYAYEIDASKENIDEKMDELVKQYYEENGGKIYAKCERICRVICA